MGKHKASSSDKRNVAVAVKLLASDTDASASGINCIFGNSLKTLASTWTSSVAYHQEKARLDIILFSHCNCMQTTSTDEMKLALPLKLTTRHHLLFTFYHITCQTKGGKVDKHTAPVEVRTMTT